MQDEASFLGLDREKFWNQSYHMRTNYQLTRDMSWMLELKTNTYPRNTQFQDLLNKTTLKGELRMEQTHTRLPVYSQWHLC